MDNFDGCHYQGSFAVGPYVSADGGHVDTVIIPFSEDHINAYRFNPDDPEVIHSNEKEQLKPATDLTDLEARFELAELLGDVQKGYDWVAITHKPYETSYDAIIPVIQGFTVEQDKIMTEYLDGMFEMGRAIYWDALIDLTPRQLLNAAIEVLRK